MLRAGTRDATISYKVIGMRVYGHSNRTSKADNVSVAMRIWFSTLSTHTAAIPLHSHLRKQKGVGGTEKYESKKSGNYILKNERGLKRKN